jgi:Cu/Ag efflux pump CusA
LKRTFRSSSIKLPAINAAYQGTIAAQTYDGNRIFRVSVILDPADRLDPEALGQLLLVNAEGNLVPLRELASITLETGRCAIRMDRAVSVAAPCLMTSWASLSITPPIWR